MALSLPKSSVLRWILLRNQLSFNGEDRVCIRIAVDEARCHSYAGEINQQQALAAGLGMHISKPVEPEELAKAIAHLLRFGIEF